jgi:hypothetical protein
MNYPAINFGSWAAESVKIQIPGILILAAIVLPALSAHRIFLNNNRSG